MIGKIRKRLLKILDKLGVALSYLYLSIEHDNAHKSQYLFERTIEYYFALKHLSENKGLNVLDVGVGITAFSAVLKQCGFNVTATDFFGSSWGTFKNRHIYVQNDDITTSRIKDHSFDAVTCISVLEHIQTHESAVQNMSRILKKDGLLILTFPYSHDQFCDDVYKLESSDAMSKTFAYFAKSFSDDQINDWCGRFGLEIADTLYFKGWEGKFWRSGNRIRFPFEVNDKQLANGVCLAFKKS